MATFNETRAPTSRKNVAEQDIVMPNWSKIFQTFWSHSSVFDLEKQLKNLNFQSFFICDSPFVATFNKTRATTSRKHVAELGIVMPHWSKLFRIFLSHCTVFAVEKNLKI